MSELLIAESAGVRKLFVNRHLDTLLTSEKAGVFRNPGKDDVPKEFWEKI